MELQNNYETVGGSVASLPSTSFKIENTPHMMEILSKKLYTNPTRAVIRELVCNAIDAHKAADNAAKVEVYAPSILDPVFIVKDFGTGLSEEDVISLYTTYGASTKNNSNDYIGCLGIGSKSPFALTDEFTVVSRYNNVATTYHCYKQQGLPVCTKLSSVATDEHNGLTISVPINEDIVQGFQNEMKAFFKGVSKSLVDVKGLTPIFYEDYVKENCLDEATFLIDEFTVRIKKFEYYAEPHIVRMGSVIYKTSVSSSYSSFVMLIDAPIGSFIISANRESLEDNKENTDKIESILQKVKDVIAQDSFRESLCQKAKTKSMRPCYRIYSLYCYLYKYSSLQEFLGHALKHEPLSAFEITKKKISKESIYQRNPSYAFISPHMTKEFPFKKFLMWFFKDNTRSIEVVFTNVLLPSYYDSKVVFVDDFYQDFLDWEKRSAKSRKNLAKYNRKNKIVSRAVKVYDTVQNYYRNVCDLDPTNEIVYALHGYPLTIEQRSNVGEFKKSCYLVSKTNLSKIKKYFKSCVFIEDFLTKHKEELDKKKYLREVSTCLLWFNGCKYSYGMDTLFNELFNSIAKGLYHWKSRDYDQLYSRLYGISYSSESITKRMDKVLSRLEPIKKEVGGVLSYVHRSASLPGDVFNFFVERSIENIKKELGIKTKPLK